MSRCLLTVVCLLPLTACTVNRPEASCATVGTWSEDTRHAARAEAKSHLKLGRRDAEDGRHAQAVDHFYLAAVSAWRGLFESGPPPTDLADDELLAVYNEAVGRCLEEGVQSGRFDAARGLRVRTPEGWRELPVVAENLPWDPARMHGWKYVSTRGVCPCRLPGRPGLGAPMVAARERDPSDPRDRHLFDTHFYPCAVMLRPPSDSGGERVEVHEVLRHTTVAAAGRVWPLAAEPSAAVDASQKATHLSQNEYLTIISADLGRSQQRLYMLEPYQPGRIPLVMVHGFLSYPWTWAEMVDRLQADPEVMRRYQIWLYDYPTGLPVPQAAADLREDLRAAVAEVDPGGTDPAVQQTVLAGHSMGGILSKMQVVSSGDVLWDEFASRPFSQMQGDAETLAFFRRMYFFEPQPFVKRVLYFATPHEGSSFPDQAQRCVGGAVSAFLDPADKDYYRRIREANPGVIRDLPSVLSPSSALYLTSPSPLLAGLNDVPPPPYAPQHTLYGDVFSPCLPVHGDLVVGADSARIPGVESELRVPVRHKYVHRDPRSVAETKRILDEHWLRSGL